MIEHHAAMENVYNAYWHGAMFTILWNRKSMLKSKYVFMLDKYIYVHLNI